MNNEEKILQMLTTLTGDVADIKGDVADIKGDVADIKGDVADLKERTTRIEITIENTVIPQIQLLAEGHVTIQNQIKRISVIERLEDDISTLKMAVKFLSNEVEDLKKAM